MTLSTLTGVSSPNCISLALAFSAEEERIDINTLQADTTRDMEGSSSLKNGPSFTPLRLRPWLTDTRDNSRGGYGNTGASEIQK